MLAFFINLIWPNSYFTDEKTGPERTSDLPKIAQLASNQARTELRFPDFCPQADTVTLY